MNSKQDFVYLGFYIYAAHRTKALVISSSKGFYLFQFILKLVQL